MKQERPVALQESPIRRPSAQLSNTNVASGGTDASLGGLVPLQAPVPRRRHSEASVLQRSHSLPMDISVDVPNNRFGGAVRLMGVSPASSVRKLRRLERKHSMKKVSPQKHTMARTPFTTPVSDSRHSGSGNRPTPSPNTDTSPRTSPRPPLHSVSTPGRSGAAGARARSPAPQPHSPLVSSPLVPRERDQSPRSPAGLVVAPAPLGTLASAGATAVQAGSCSITAMPLQGRRGAVQLKAARQRQREAQQQYYIWQQQQQQQQHEQQQIPNQRQLQRPSHLSHYDQPPSPRVQQLRGDATGTVGAKADRGTPSTSAVTMGAHKGHSDGSPRTSPAGVVPRTPSSPVTPLTPHSACSIHSAQSTPCSIHSPRSGRSTPGSARRNSKTQSEISAELSMMGELTPRVMRERRRLSAIRSASEDEGDSNPRGRTSTRSMRRRQSRSPARGSSRSEQSPTTPERAKRRGSDSSVGSPYSPSYASSPCSTPRTPHSPYSPFSPYSPYSPYSPGSGSRPPRHPGSSGGGTQSKRRSRRRRPTHEGECGACPLDECAKHLSFSGRLQQAVGCSCKCYRCCVADICVSFCQATNIIWFQRCCEKWCTCSNAKTQSGKNGEADLESGRNVQRASKRSTRRVFRLLCCEIATARRAGRCCRKLRLHEPSRFIIFIIVYTMALFVMFSHHASSQLATKPAD